MSELITVSECCKGEIIHTDFNFTGYPIPVDICEICGAENPETIKISQHEFDELEGIEE